MPGDDSALRLLPTPARLRIPLASRAQTEAPPLLAPGAAVAKGEPLSIGLAPGEAAALAPTSGRVVGPCFVTLANGQTVAAVEIEVDYQDRAPLEEHDHVHASGLRDIFDPHDKLTPDDLGPWIDRLRNAGVWADRLHSPDLLGQLHQVLRRPVDTLICNLVDHDPMLRLQSMTAARFGAVLVAGVALLARLTGARNVWVAVEAGSTPKWWSPLRRELKRAGVDVIPVLADYPQADPTLLIYTLLRRRLRPGRSPVEQGVLMLDGVSAIAVGRAAAREQPMLQTPVAVRDHLGSKSHLIAAPIGASVRDLFDHLALPLAGNTVLRGDVLRDQPLPADAVVAGGELSLHLLPTTLPSIADPCIRCGWCVQTCPTLVQPAGLLEAAQRRDLDLAERDGLDACIECGICAYMCPSHLPLLQGIRALKAMRRTAATADLPSDRASRD
jgi:electron transport complex protein RnfC